MIIALLSPVRPANSPFRRAEKLVHSGDLIGWTADRVTNELSIPAAATEGAFGDWDIVYDLGDDVSYLVPVSITWLVLKIDINGK